MSQRQKIYGETFSEQAPEPTRVVFEVLSEHIAQGSNPNSETHEVLNDIYKALANTEPEATRRLEEFETRGEISREDGLILTVLLTTSKPLGINLDSLRLAIQTNNFSQLAEQGLQIPETHPNISGYIQNLAIKLNKKN